MDAGRQRQRRHHEWRKHRLIFERPAIVLDSAIGEDGQRRVFRPRD